MAEVRKIVKVFLASPGDLEEERKAAKQIADEFNELLADTFGYNIELVGWEDTVSRAGRPQATINREMDRCELFVGMLHRKWGTRPTINGPYSSGFEEEYRRSVERRDRSGTPEISLFLKEIPPEFLTDPGDDLKKVLEFRDQVTAEQNILFEKFSDSADFQRRFRRCVTKYISNLYKRERINELALNQAPALDHEAAEFSNSSDSPENQPFSTASKAFLKRFIETNADAHPFPAADIARFRLLALSLEANGNDDRTLGVHDANLLFLHRDGYNFSSEECFALLSSALENHAHQNVPLWRWVLAVDGFVTPQLQFISIYDSSNQRRVGALGAMSIIKMGLPDSQDRDVFLAIWFGDASPNNLRVAALDYLRIDGIKSDALIIRKEFERNDNKTSRAAADSLLAITMRESYEAALRLLDELQFMSVSNEMLDELFRNVPDSLLPIIINFVKHSNVAVRRRATELLSERRKLSITLATNLTGDSDARVRLFSLKALSDEGQLTDIDEARNVLIKPSATGTANSLLTLFGSDSEGQRAFDEYRRFHFDKLDDVKLAALAAKPLVVDSEAYFANAKRLFGDYKADIRRDFQDRYKSKFIVEANKIIPSLNDSSAQAEKLRSLETSIRKELVSKAFEVICCCGDQYDLEGVRVAMRDEFIDFTISAVKFLERFGSFDDIRLIIDALGRRKWSLLLGDAEMDYRVLATTILHLGINNLAELLTMKMPSELARWLISEIEDDTFQNLDDMALSALFSLEDDNVRKVVAMKCIKTNDRDRLVRILKNYLSGGSQYYYNVVHWLDFGISVPHEILKPAVLRLLETEQL